MEFSTSITVGGQSVSLVGPAIRGTRAWQKANSVFCPLGPAHSEAWLLLTKKAIDAIQGLLTSDVTIEWTMQCPSPNASSSVTLYMQGWRLLQAERIFIGGPADPAGLFLCQFVDARYRAKNENSGPIRANIRSYANAADYLTGTSGETWTTLVEDLWNACGVLGTYSGLPAGLPIDGVPETQFLIALNAWRSLCTVLDQLDCAVKHDPINNTYTIIQLGATQALTLNTNRLKFNGEPSMSNVGCADTVRVHFFYHRKGYGQERDMELATNWAVVGASDVIDLATGITGSSGTKTLWDDQPWILNENEAHTNNSDNVTRADNRKARYVTRYTVNPAHKIFSGLLGYLPGGQIRAVLWRNWGDSDNPLGGTVTEYVSGPDLITGFNSGDDGDAEFIWLDANIVTPEREAFSPTDYGRHSYPNYPRLPNIVQINHASATAGDEVSPNADGFHKGRVRRWVANAMATLDDCWIRFVNEHDTLAGQVSGIQGEFYYGRLSGVSTSGGTLRPVYLVQRGSTSLSIVRFKLTGNLQILDTDADASNGANAPAVIRTFNGTVYADSTVITVYDMYSITTQAPGSFRGMWCGIAGMEGYAVKRSIPFVSQANEYEILWMEQFGRFVEFTLLEDMSYSQENAALATVDKIYGQGDFLDPTTPGQNPTILIHDRQELFPHALMGAHGVAVRDEYADPTTPQTPYYSVVTCQQMVIYATAKLSDDMCSPGEVNIYDFVGRSFSIFGQDPSPLPNTANNVFQHKGFYGYKVWLMWKKFNAAELAERAEQQLPTKPGEWVIIDVEKTAHEVVLNVRWDGICLIQKKVTIAVETCIEPYELDITCTIDCP